MAYEQTDALKRKIEQLSTPVFSGGGAGLANAIRMRRAGKYEKQLTAAEERNQANQAQELAMLLKGAETGRVGPTLVSAQLQDFNPTDPTVRELAAKLRLDKATKEPARPQVVGRGGALVDDAGNPLYKNPYEFDPNSGGGSSTPSTIQQYEYAEKLRNSGDSEAYARFMAQVRNPYLDKGGEFTNPYASGSPVLPSIEKTLPPQDLPATRGAQAAAVEGAQTAAMVERVPIELAKLEQAGVISNQQKLALEQALTPIMVGRAGETQQVTGDISTAQNLAQAQGTADINQNRTAAEGVIKGTTDRYYEAIPKAESAAQTIRLMDQFLTASPDSPSGSLAPIVTSLKNLVASTGGNPSGLTETALMQAANAGSLSSLMASLGARGLTDADMRTLSAALPNITTSRDAREAVAKVVKENANRTLSEFSQLDDAMRSNESYGRYAPPLPFMDDWRKSNQQQLPTTGRFQVISVE